MKNLLNNFIKLIQKQFGGIKSNSVKQEKQKLRQKIKNQWNEIYKKTSRIQNREIQNFVSNALKKLKKEDVFLRAKEILIYAPDKYEIPFVEKLMKQFPEKHYAFPKVRNNEMQFFFAKFSDLKKGNFGLLEPCENSPCFTQGSRRNFREPKRSDANKTLVITPALSCDKNRTRLGRGSGFYDKFLANFSGIFTLVVIPKFAFLDKIPSESHDKKVDKIIVC